MTLPLKFRITVILCLLLVSCGNRKEIITADAAIPADSMISSEKMIHILADVHVVEAAILLERNRGLVSKVDPGFYYQGIFNKNHVSQARYDENLRYYQQKPTEFIKMYDRVIRELENREKQFSTKR